MQATAEREPFTRDELDLMIDLGAAGIERIMAAQDDAVAHVGADLELWEACCASSWRRSSRA